VIVVDALQGYARLVVFEWRFVGIDGLLNLGYQSVVYDDFIKGFGRRSAKLRMPLII